VSAKELRVVVANPLPAELCEKIAQAEPRIDLVVDQTLLPPQRWPADFDGDPTFRRSDAQQKTFEAMLDSADALYGIPDIDSKALARTVRANPNLRWVQVMAAGGGSQVKDANLTPEELERVTFTTSAGVHAGPLAEFAIFGLLAGAKHLPRLDRYKQQRHWPGRWPMGQLSEQRILILGLGGIGKEVARKAIALGAEVYAVANSKPDISGIKGIFKTDDLKHVIGEFDGIVNCLPGTAATYKYLSKDLIERMKPGATVASVGRGTVVDEDALASALEREHVGFAALDVFATEPLPQNSPLWTLPNTIISPHTAANSEHEERLIAELFIKNSKRFLSGDELLNTVNTVHFY